MVTSRYASYSKPINPEHNNPAFLTFLLNKTAFIHMINIRKMLKLKVFI